LTEHPLSPEEASWLPEGGTALLLYEELRNSAFPTEILLEFMESTYQAGFSVPCIARYCRVLRPS
jgi:hypothetical protein